MNVFELSAKIALDTKEYEAALKKAKTDQEQFSKNLLNVADNTDALKNRINMLVTQYTQARTRVSELTRAFNESAAKTGVMSSETQRLARELDDAQKEADELKDSLDSYSNATGKAAENTKNDTNSMQKFWGGFGVTVIGIITGIIAATTAGLTNLTKIGVGYNSQIESYVTNFRVLLGDAEAATEKVNDLREMAANTPFGLGDLASATQTLLSFGVEADNTQNILKMLGDVSLGDSQRLQSLTLAFSQASSTGKLMGQDLLQMINAGFNPLNQLAEETGLSIGQLKEIMSGLGEDALESMKNLEGVTELGQQIIDRGYISAEDLLLALQAATKEGGSFYNGMEEASKTTSGLLSTLKDDATELIGKFFEPVSNLLKSDILPNASALVAAIGKILDPKTSAQGIEEITAGVNAIVNGISSFVNDNSEAFVNVGMSMLLAIVAGIANNAPLLIPPIENAINIALNSLVDNAPELLNSAASLIGTILSAVSALIRASSGPIARGISVIVSALPDLVKTIGEEVDFSDIVQIALVSPLIIAILDNLPLIISTVLSVVPELAYTATSTLARQIPAILSAFGDVIIASVKGIINGAWIVLTDSKQSLYDGAASLLQGISLMVLGFVEGIIQNVGKIPGAIKDIFSGNKTIEDVIGSFDGWLSNITTDLSGGVESFGRKLASGHEYSDIYGENAINTRDLVIGYSQDAGSRISGGATIENIDIKIDITNPNATPDEISDAVTEALSAQLFEFSKRRGAAYGEP